MGWAVNKLVWVGSWRTTRGKNHQNKARPKAGQSERGGETKYHHAEIRWKDVNTGRILFHGRFNPDEPDRIARLVGRMSRQCRENKRSAPRGRWRGPIHRGVLKELDRWGGGRGRAAQQRRLQGPGLGRVAGRSPTRGEASAAGIPEGRKQRRHWRRPVDGVREKAFWPDSLRRLLFDNWRQGYG